MDDRTRENWQKIKDTMEASGNTKNMFYKRACEVMRTGVDPMEKMFNGKNNKEIFDKILLLL